MSYKEVSKESVVQEILSHTRKSHVEVIETVDDTFVEIGQYPNTIILDEMEWMKLKDILNALKGNKND